MSYTSQSTGHFAQFRDVTESNMQEISGNIKYGRRGSN